MPFTMRYSVLLIGSAASRSVEQYCHFYEYQQSICLLMEKGDNFIGSMKDKRLRGVSKHEVFFWSDEPEQPVYNSSNWSIQGANTASKGVWSFPRDMSLPWPTDYDKITYKKVKRKNDKAEYYDVTFAPSSSPRQFTKLEPISLSDMENNKEVAVNTRPLTFMTDHYYCIKANVMPQEVSRNRGSKGDFSISASFEIPVLFIGQIRSHEFIDTTKGQSKVRTLSATKPTPLFKTAEAFIFKFPIEGPVQYGAMFHTNGFSYVLYRVE